MLKTARPKALGMSPQRLYAIRKASDHGDMPKEEVMRTHLKMAGWTQVQNELWVH